jgi:hypothetical protein
MERFERTKRFMDLTRVKPGNKICLKDLETGWAQNEETKMLGKSKLKEQANKLLEKNRATLQKPRASVC